MKPTMCVDYLSHEWDADDLIHTLREVRHQAAHHLSGEVTLPLSDSFGKTEHSRLARLQNVLWRQMARSCTSQLSQANLLVHPSVVNWQKESDITWLYGPVYSLQEPPSPVPSSPISSSSDSQHCGLKPVLKKTKPPKDDWAELSLLPTWSDLAVHPFHTSSWSRCMSETASVSSASSFSSSSCSSSSSSNANVSVRFSCDIVQVEYLPESPVRESIDCPHGYNSADYSIWRQRQCLRDMELFSDDEEDDLSFVIDATFLIWHYCRASMSRLFHAIYATSAWQPLSLFNLLRSWFFRHPLQYKDTTIIVLSMTKSLVALATTWLLYQSLLPITWIVNHHLSNKRRYRN